MALSSPGSFPFYRALRSDLAAQAGSLLHCSQNRRLGQREVASHWTKSTAFANQIDLASHKRLTARQISWTHKLFPERFLLN